MVVKTDGRKIRKLANGSVCGFAGKREEELNINEEHGNCF
jgi:hypothetical protein